MRVGGTMIDSLTMYRIRWPDPRDCTEEGIEASSDATLALIRGPVGSNPVLPANNGIQSNGSLKFRDRYGDTVLAEIGDEIEVTDRGWELFPNA